MFITTSWPTIHKWGHLPNFTKNDFWQIFTLTYQASFLFFTL